MHYTLTGTSKYIHTFILIVGLIVLSSCSFLSSELRDTGSIAGATQTGNTIAIASKTGVSLSDPDLLASLNVRLFNTHDTVSYITQTKLTPTSKVMGTYLFTDIPAGTYFIGFYYNSTLVGEAGDIIVMVNRETTIPQNSVTENGIQSNYPNIVKQINAQTTSTLSLYISEVCNDTVDNDGDTYIDCEDSKCSTSIFCVVNSSSNPQMSVSSSIYSSSTPIGDLYMVSSSSVAEVNGVPSSNQVLTENDTTTCTDGIDNDADGLIDIQEGECSIYFNIPENSAALCSDGVDNDLDAKIDCVDDDCVPFSVCTPTLENTLTKCLDSLDNDLDGLTDCDDSDCTIYNACKPNEPEATSVLCNDNHDNDQDGLTDCDDSDCDTFCIPGDEFTWEECLDLIDNDGDGTFDCEDSDCLQYQHCSIGETNLTECTDGINNDTENAEFDIQEYSCHHFYLAMVIEESHLCVDGVDNDRDGSVDCLDDGCSTQPSCLGPFEGTEANCQDSSDNDSDSLLDCNDPDCLNTMACAGNNPPENTKESCFDIIDNDNDGQIDIQDEECHPFYLDLLN